MCRNIKRTWAVEIRFLKQGKKITVSSKYLNRHNYFQTTELEIIESRYRQIDLIFFFLRVVNDTKYEAGQEMLL